MNDFDLQMAAAKLAEALLPDDELRQQKANAVVISQDGGVHSRPLVQSLPWYRADVTIAGPVSTGTGVAMIPFPQGATVRHVSRFAATPPTSSSFNFRLNAGADSQSFSLQVGEASRMSGADIDIPPGGWLSLDVTQAGGVEDVTVTIHYTAGGG